jgi:predicted amidohydrolase YtcJ
MRLWFCHAVLLAVAVVAAPTLAPAQAPDAVLVNGKIVTVDVRFTIAQALAIRGQRIVKVGTTAEIEALKGPQTRTIDLAGRTVIPGLIDNHAHWVRAAEHDELRFDGVTSRQQALRMLAERVRTTPPGQWIVVLGGWSEEQFTDEPRGFPLEELDRIAPNNPVVLQAVYRHSYLNTVAPQRRTRRAARSKRMRPGSRPASSRAPAASPSWRPGCRYRRRTLGSPTPASWWPTSTRWG